MIWCLHFILLHYSDDLWLFKLNTQTLCDFVFVHECVSCVNKVIFACGGGAEDEKTNLCASPCPHLSSGWKSQSDITRWICSEDFKGMRQIQAE